MTAPTNTLDAARPGRGATASRARQEVEGPEASGARPSTPLNAEVEPSPRSLGTPAGPSPRPAGRSAAPAPSGAAGHIPRVLGLDLAANSNGVALPDGTTLTIHAPKLKPSGRKRTLTDDLARLDHIARQITHYLLLHDVDLAVIEDYAAGLRSAAAHRLAEISGTVRLACYRASVPIALVNNQHLKIYAFGKATADKGDMRIAALKRAGIEFPNDDEADAWWLRALGLDHLGHPVVDMPQTNRAVLTKVHWPMLTAPEPTALFDQPEGVISTC